VNTYKTLLLGLLYFSLVGRQYRLFDPRENVSERGTSLFRNREFYAAIELDVFIRKYESFIVSRSYKGNRFSSYVKVQFLLSAGLERRGEYMNGFGFTLHVASWKSCIFSHNISGFVSQAGWDRGNVLHYLQRVRQSFVQFLSCFIIRFPRLINCETDHIS
jgi:hypothetical protein